MADDMKRETPEQLHERLRVAQQLVPMGQWIRHVRTGGEYIVSGHALRVGDLAALVLYRPRFGPAVTFSRELIGITAKFVLSDGEAWPDPAAREGTQ